MFYIDNDIFVLLKNHSVMQHCLFILPVRMFLNASSTFVESKADVSINDRVFFSRVWEKKRHICREQGFEV